MNAAAALCRSLAMLAALILSACSASGPMSGYTRDVPAPPAVVYESLKSMNLLGNSGIGPFDSLPHFEIEGDPGKSIRFIMRSGEQVGMTTTITLADAVVGNRLGTHLVATHEDGVVPQNLQSVLASPEGPAGYLRKALDAQLALFDGNPVEAARLAKEAQQASQMLTMSQVMANPWAIGLEDARDRREERARSAQEAREAAQNPVAPPSSPSAAPASSTPGAPTFAARSDTTYDAARAGRSDGTFVAGAPSTQFGRDPYESRTR